jgi:hypothetical protein
MCFSFQLAFEIVKMLMLQVATVLGYLAFILTFKSLGAHLICYCSSFTFEVLAWVFE